MKKVRRKLLLYGLVAVFMLSVMSVAMADTAVQPGQQPSLFKDVAAGDNNRIYINYLAKRGLVSGFPDGGFHPAEGLSRAQAATLLVKAAGLKTGEVKTNVFKDVDPSHWAAANIAAAAGAGYLKGFPDGNYHPEEILSRAQGTSLVLRLSRQEDSGAALPDLKDMDDSHWAARSVAIGLAAGMVGLNSDQDQFLPDQEFSRGDLSRALAVLLTTDPGFNQVEMNGSLEVKAGIVKVNNKTVEKSVSIKAGDIITTQAKAEAQLSYPDGSGLLIMELTTLQVKETRGTSYIKSDGTPGTGVDWLLADLEKGEVFGALAANPNIKEEESPEKETAGGHLLASLSGGLNLLAAQSQEPPWYQAAQQKKVKVQVDMPWGVAAVRGSFWSNLVTAAGCSTSLLEGDAQVTAGGETVPLSPGTSSAANQGAAAPTPPAPMSAAEVTQWVQQAAWIQTVAQEIQTNQAAVQAAAVITAPVQPNAQPTVVNPITPVTPVTPATPVTPVTPAAPVAPNVLNTVSQALNQAQQQAGFQTTINLNDLPAADIQSVIQQVINSAPAGSIGFAGGGGVNWDSGSSPEYSDDSSTPSFLYRVAGTPAYLYVNSLSANGGKLNLSGRTVPNGTVLIESPLLQEYQVPAVANASGYFSFTNIGLRDCPADQRYLWVHQQLGDVATGEYVSSVFIPDALNSPRIPAYFEAERGVYTNQSTDVVMGCKVTPGQHLSYYVTEVWGSGHWEGSIPASGVFSINVGPQPSGAPLGIEVTDSGTGRLVAMGNTYVYSASAVSVTYTSPYSEATVNADLNQMSVFFDRTVSPGANFDSIALTAGGSPIATDLTLNGSVLTVSIKQNLGYGKTCALSIPAGAIADYINNGNVLPEFSLSFNTAEESQTANIVIPESIYGPYFDCLTSRNANGPTYSYNDISSTYDSYDHLQDDTYIQQAIGFSFSFYGSGYNQVYIGTNGYLTLGGGDSTGNNYSFADLWASGYPRIAPFFDDLRPNASGSVKIYRKLEGTAPNRKLTVQWRVQDNFYSSSNTADFEVILYEGSNQILFQYKDTVFGNSSDYGSSATVGLNKGDGQISLLYSYNTASLMDGLAMKFTPRTQGILAVTPDPGAVPEIVDVSVTVNISTYGLTDGAAVAVQLLDPAGNPVGSVAAANATLSGNAASTTLYIPAHTSPGTYYIRASISGVPSVDGTFDIHAVSSGGGGGGSAAWETLGSALTAHPGSGIGMVIGTVPYVAYVDSSGVQVKALNGAGPAWEAVGSAIGANGDPVDLSLQGDAPLVAYLTSGGSPTVSSYADGLRAELSGGTPPSGTAASLSLDVGSLNGGAELYPYLAYKSGGSVYAYVYQDCGWQSLGSVGDASSSGAISIDTASGTPYLAYLNSDNMATVQAYEDYDDDDVYEWSIIDDSSWSQASSVALTTGGGKLYVAYRDGVAGGKGRVMEGAYIPGSGWSWNDLGCFSDGTEGTDEPDGTADCISLAFDNDILYAAYSDGTQSDQLTVKSCIDSQWYPMGPDDASLNYVAATRIRACDGYVYVAYKNSSGIITVMKI